MNYFLVYHSESKNYAIFTNSYTWSDWHDTLFLAFTHILHTPLTHRCIELPPNPEVYLNEPYLHILLKFSHLPATYADFCDQYPELFI